jgi:hypothetical protein
MANTSVEFELWFGAANTLVEFEFNSFYVENNYLPYPPQLCMTVIPKEDDDMTIIASNDIQPLSLCQ